MNVPIKADIVIVGAGMVGSLLAAALKHLPLNIILIDPAVVTLPDVDAPFEPRVSALTRASQNVLTQVGAWELVTQYRHSPFTSMQVREEEGRGELQFKAQDIGEDYLGCLVENRVLQWALTTVAINADNVEFLAPEQLTQLERYPQHWRVTLASGKVIDTPLVVGADGAMSAVRKLSAITMETWDYQQQAIVCTVQTQKPHDSCARQVFLKTGPLAFLPLSKPDYCSIVWSAKDEQAKWLLSLSESDFKQELARAFGYELGEVLWCDQRYAFPLIARHAERYTLDGLALVGDAAHTIHPLAGQGVNLGFLDAAVLAEEIARGMARGLPIAHRQILQKYSLRRRHHNALMMHSMTALERLYAAKQPSLIMLRNEGVGFVNNQTWLKHFFEKQAMGLEGDLPQLAQNCSA
ncbi:2-octaprenyl-3-methyl-6-methoxy-1,4-benzoquinol hydroxylase [Moraxellaceae bacterium AER2_44_116]|nr:UbiH/UbiF/VisC/COQ6 family ubiquinone biosynthesis hydroxylase [Moraxellaceae bacterium]TQD00034.1 2-octaprenyl-3-methyl-6-methoxy-1,4-benzoquinol hydroxylase [Moraxellaceae bacterium AER2_44_116]